MKTEKSECWCTADLLDEFRPKLDCEQTLVVHDRCESLVVEISDIVDVTDPERWGVYLADIAFVISGEIVDEMSDTHTPITREQAMALIRKGFNSGNTWLPERVGFPEVSK